MLLKEILVKLCEGEFSDLALGYQVDDKPLGENYAKIVRYVDMGVLELHKRFPLRLKELNIQQDELLQNYQLDSNYAVSNTSSVEPFKYILDSEEDPFVDSDFLCIDGVLDSLGCPLPLNDTMDAYSVYTAGYNTIIVPYLLDMGTFTVKYRASHGNLDSELDPSLVKVKFPYSHLEALLYYVAYRAMATTSADLSNAYMMKFEQSCNKLKELRMENKDGTTPQHFFLGGWV